jgi:hypothetical protein
MRQEVSYQLVGYDPTTESLAFEQDIPSDKWDRIKSLLRPDPSDPDYIYTYPLDLALASDIMGMFGNREVKGLNYYIECSAIS